ncbi:MAG TPA: glycosyltransferase [Terriglobales bacterium]|nr:glycosyltransferase [Terriglobales bacterium]
MHAHIGHINKYWGRDRGGVEAVLHAQAVDLRRREYAVSVLACRRWGGAAREFPMGIAGRELVAPVVASMPVHFGFARAVRGLARECDLLHFHLPFPLAEAAALRLDKRIPWVATVHAEVLGHSAWMRYLQRRVTERFLQRMDAIIVSSATNSQVETLKAHQPRIRVLPFGFDLSAYLVLNHVGARAGGRLRVIFLGRLVAYKGIDVLLRALAKIETGTIEAEVIGIGVELQRLRRLTRELRLENRVAFAGHVADAELPRRLQAADVFVLPSRSAAETFGVAQVEAMAAGLPVVNTALRTGTDWVSVHGLTGLTVRPNDVEDLAGALRHMASQRDFRLACGRRARARVRELFSIERRGAEMAALYEELLA